MTDETTNPDDERLLDEFRKLVGRADAVPESVRRGARGSFTWRTIDAELAELLRDSALEDEVAAGVRTLGVRQLTFESRGLTIEIEVVEHEGACRLIGQVAPAQSASVTVQHAGGSSEATADDLGRFAVDGVPRGPVALSFALANAVVKTEWIVL